jgi:hypothetical protein
MENEEMNIQLHIQSVNFMSFCDLPNKNKHKYLLRFVKYLRILQNQ